jgi:flagellar M-ring protein FliF
MNKLFSNLSLGQRITIAFVALAVAGGIYGLVHWQKETDFKPLYTGVSQEDAAAIVQKLKESGVEYRLPEAGGAVLVPSARVAELRLAMAAAGLPKTGRIGFELFDKANLGATEFTEHVNYRRALEGELERSVMSLFEVEQARVHITFPKESVYLEAQEPAKASVLVKIRPGARISPQNVMAIDHLVASAVEGLSPDAVSVLDMNGNLLGRPKASGSLDGSDPEGAILEYRHSVETDLLAKINSALEPLLGPDKFRAGVSVECDFTGADVSEEVYDPGRTVMASSQRTEDASGGSSASGVPGTGSNLPRPSSRPGSAGNRVTRMTENITYQATRTVRKTRLPAGTIKKMSVAVLVDHDLNWQQEKTGYKKLLSAPSPEKLKTIKDVVAGVTGLNTERGDQLVVEALPFESTLTMEPPDTTRPAPPKTGPLNWPPDQKTILMGAGAAVVLIGLGFIMAILFRGGKGKTASVPTALPAGESAPRHPAVAAAPGTPIEEQIESKLAQRDALQHQMDQQALNALDIAPVITKTAEVMAKHLREKIKQDPEVPAQVLRTWLHDSDTTV